MMNFYLKKLITKTSMKRSRRELSINIVIDRSIFQNNQVTLSPCFTFIPQTNIGLPKTGLCFFTVHNFKRVIRWELNFFSLFFCFFRFFHEAV